MSIISIDPSLLLLASNPGSSSLGSVNTGSSLLGLGSSGLPSVTQYQIEQQNAAQLQKQSDASPQVQQAVSYFEANIGNVKSVNDLFNNYQLSQFVLGASNLADQGNALGLVKKALTQDPSDKNSLANQLTDTRFKTASQQLQLYNGLSYLQSAAGKAAVIAAYKSNTFTTNLAGDNPAVAQAVAFKQIAKNAKNAFDVLGNSVIRDVVQVAYNIPQQLAFQPVDDQAALINRTFNVSNLQNPKFVDSVINQYLVQYDIQNSSASSSGGGLASYGFGSGSSSA